MQIGLRFTSQWAALFLALSLPATSDAQTMSRTNSGVAPAAGVATQQPSSGASSRPQPDQRSPLNGRGEPFNMEGTPALDNSKTGRKLRRPASTDQDPVPTAPASDPIREESIRKDCVMAADPADCRTRARQGLIDDSIERDPP